MEEAGLYKKHTGVFLDKEYWTEVRPKRGKPSEGYGRADLGLSEKSKMDSDKGRGQ